VSGTQQTSGTAGVEDIVKDFWSTRPRRPRRGRKVAGVAAGIARRYRLDPTLVRVAFVVASVYGGAGIVAYLLGWLFLPELDDEVSPFESLIGRGRSSTSSAFTVVLCLALIPTFSWFFDGFFPGFPGYLSVLVLAGVLFLLHRSRGHLGPAPAEPDTAASSTVNMATPGTTMPLPDDAATSATSATSAAAAAEPPPVAERRQDAGEAAYPETPPAWDPLGAAPFAWDLPDPTPQHDEDDEEPPAPRRKSRIGLLTAGIALITAAVLSSVAGGWIDPPHIIGIVLAVLGAGMVVGSFRRGGRGLIGLAVPLAAIGIGMTVVFPNGMQGAVGDLEAKPAALSDVRSSYERSVGSIELDLTELPASGEVDTKIHLQLGDATVIVPDNANVEVVCESDLGSIKCLGHDEAGPDNEAVRVSDQGTDGAGGLDIELKVKVDTGSVEVRRG
jgi:phage shock protein PspC (stress-responsive transcriptional regulator)